jgi:hypothetical protein
MVLPDCLISALSLLAWTGVATTGLRVFTLMTHEVVEVRIADLEKAMCYCTDGGTVPLSIACVSQPAARVEGRQISMLRRLSKGSGLLQGKETKRYAHWRRQLK